MFNLVKLALIAILICANHAAFAGDGDYTAYKPKKIRRQWQSPTKPKPILRAVYH